MTSRHVILIHGTWCNGDNWGDFATELQAQGYVVHTPTYRFHGNPRTSDIWANAQQVRTVGLLDYVADLKELADSLDSPPIIIGHSVGALLAQLLAARVHTAGVVLLGPAPTWGTLPLSRSMVALWGRYLPQWLTSKPMYPVSFTAWSKYIANTTPDDISRAYYATLCAESGTAYRQMVTWYLDPTRAARVDFAAVDAPVLVVTGSEDKCTIPRIGKVTAAKYGDAATYVELAGSDHMMTTGPFMPTTLKTIRTWAKAHHLHPSALSTDA